MPVAFGNDEGVERRRHRIVAEHAEQRIYKYALPVGAGSIEEKQNMLVRVAGAAIAGNALEICFKLSISASYLVEEFVPGRASAAGRYRGHLGDVVQRIV